MSDNTVIMVFEKVSKPAEMLILCRLTGLNYLVNDEAQYLSTAILNDLKIILNFDCDSLNCVCLVLCGEPHFNNTLYKPVHEALLQRVTVRKV